jgi:hypothetical protein
MDKKEMKARIEEMLSAGEKKRDVFDALSGEGVKDRVIAYWIAAHVAPQRCAANKWHIRALIVISWIELVLGLLVGFSIGVKTSPVAGLVTGVAVGLFCALFVWGFTKNRANVYNATILITLIQIPRAVQGFSSESGITLIALLINLALVAYVWFVRNRLFPDFAFVSPRKSNGQYVFSD